MPSNRHYILDAGHGGLIDGVYTTSTKWWKRAYYKDGKLMSSGMGLDWLEKNCDEKFYEGVWNREIRELISQKLSEAGISHEYLDDSENDLDIYDRAYRANLIALKSDLPCVLISIHSNAGGGRGFEVFTSRGYIQADPLGQILAEEIFSEFDEQPARKDLRDGDFDKEADFLVLKRTAMPAILSENLFYDNYNQYLLIINDDIKERIAEAHYRAILRMDEI